MRTTLSINRLCGVLVLVAVGAVASLAAPAVDATAAASSRPWCTSYVAYQHDRNVYHVSGTGLPGDADIEYRANVKHTVLKKVWKNIYRRVRVTEHYTSTREPWFGPAIDMNAGDVTVWNTKINRAAATCSIKREGPVRASVE